MTVVGVHGIWQQQRGRHQLVAEWGPAMADGLERAAGRGVGQPKLDIAFYADLLVPSRQGKSIVDDTYLLAGLSDEELVDLSAAALELDPRADLDRAGEDGKGVPAFPLVVQRLIRAVDRRFRLPVGLLVLGELRQVRRYLSDPSLKAAVDEVVAATVSSSTRVLVGHSLGSVVALEYVRQHPDRKLGLLLTLGSPLALRMIRSHLPDPTFGMGEGTPAAVDRWVNVHDPQDPIAAAGGLSRLWTGVDDRMVENEFDAHSVQRYLSKKVTGDAILTALPDLQA